MYYVIMNDFNSSFMPKYLHALVDDKKQINSSWEYNSSEHSYPEYLIDPECPKDIYLLCRKDVGALKFSYYKHGMGHIISDAMFNIFDQFNKSGLSSRELIATSIGNGEVLRSDLNYVYFFGGEGLVDLKNSEIEEDKRGRKVPYNLVFNEKAKIYDIFTIRETVLRGFLFVSSAVASELESVKGIKLVPQDEVLINYCVDYGYDIQENKKTNRKLP